MSEKTCEESVNDWKSVVKLLKEENAKFRAALRYIARDEAAIEEDCAHEQADMYVAKAREALYGE